MLDNGFLIIWYDVPPAIEAEFQRWHRIEHMPERLSIPGFTLGRRYVDPAGSRYRYLNVYEGRSVEVFSSEIYRARLAAPTPWTKRMSAGMHNFIRRVCRTSASAGTMIGGAAATYRLLLAEDRPDAELIRAVMGVNDTVSAHLGVVDDEITYLRADELQLRSSTGTEPFNAVLIVEGDSRAALSRVLPEVNALLTKFTADRTLITPQVYDLALLAPASPG